MFTAAKRTRIENVVVTSAVVLTSLSIDTILMGKKVYPITELREYVARVCNLSCNILDREMISYYYQREIGWLTIDFHATCKHLGMVGKFLGREEQKA